MIVRKLRLQRGWSQEQLASLTGLNIRTIQRIERGQTPSLESKKSFAAVFEVELATFDQKSNLENETRQSPINKDQEDIMTEHEIETVSKDEEYAMKYIEGIKAFYTHLAVYIPLSLVILFKKGYEQGVLLGLTGWTIGVIVHGLIAHEKLTIFSAKWERDLIEKKLGHKL